MSEEISKQLQSITRDVPVLDKKTFYYRGRGSWEMTHEELIDCCVEMATLYNETFKKYIEECRL